MQRYAEAEAVLNVVLERDPRNVYAKEALANALAGRSTPLSAGSGAQACPDGQIHRPFGWFGVAGMPWRADQRLFGRFGGAGMP